MPGFSYAEGGYVPLGPSGWLIPSLDVYIFIGFVCVRWIVRSMDAWDAWLYGYMAQFKWKFEWQSVRGTCRLGGAFNLGRRH